MANVQASGLRDTIRTVDAAHRTSRLEAMTIYLLETICGRSRSRVWKCGVMVNHRLEGMSRCRVERTVLDMIAPDGSTYVRTRATPNFALRANG